MSNFQLQQYTGVSSRKLCPQCNKKEFTLYIDTETGEFLADYVGRCNRETSCGYHYTPKEYYITKGITREYNPNSLIKKTEEKPASFINQKVLEETLNNYSSNNFTAFLINRFGSKATTKLIEDYFLGTYKGENTVFWQIDSFGKIRTGKIMLYNPETGKRVKDTYSHINWIHKNINNQEYNLKQCFFGEHLISRSNKPIAIVESEKTAIISSLYLPQYTWLATGGLNNLKAEKCHSLKGKNVILFPDLGCLDKWSEKAEALKSICNIKISNLLELNSSDLAKKNGHDLADYLLKFDLEAFKPQKAYSSYTKEERLKFGLKKFPVIELKEFAKEIASDWIDQEDLMAKLQKDLCYNDAEDLIDIMCIRNTLKINKLKYKYNNQ